MADERKATDILLNIEQDILIIKKNLENTNFSQSLLLKKIDQLNKLLVAFQESKPAPISKKVGSVEAYIPTISKKSSQSASPVEPTKQILQNDPIRQDKKPESERKKNKVGSPTAEILAKKISVQQGILYPNGKNAILVNIEIIDEEGNLVKKTKTGPMGKWNAQLLPGKYNVKATKSSSRDQPAINKQCAIEVIASDKLLELPVI